MRRHTTLITRFCAGALFLTASHAGAAEHGMDEKALSQIPENLKPLERTACAFLSQASLLQSIVLVAQRGIRPQDNRRT